MSIKQYADDVAGRLWKVWRNDTLISIYTYDANGNRLSHTSLTGTVTGTYDAQDRLVGYGAATYLYTANGELQAKVEGSDTTRYAYDSFGNLVRIVMPNRDVVEYLIDGENRRIARKLNGAIVSRYLYSNDILPVAELDSAGSVLSRFMGTYMWTGGRNLRFITDHLGSVRMVIDASNGSIVQKIEYDEFGQVLADDNPGFQPFGFGKGLYEHATGLTMFGARNYDPQSGRWTQKDPIGFDGGDENLYCYVSNDPINFVDPFGLTTWPTTSRNVTSPYGPRILNGTPGFHDGVDLRSRLRGSIFASDAGVIAEIRVSPRGGNEIIIHNDDGSISGYAHTAATIKEGDRVAEGEIIGYSDGSPEGVESHLHYSYRPYHGAEKIDPLPHLLSNVPCDNAQTAQPRATFKQTLRKIVLAVFRFLYD
jgi:RHS repeat-associated protein